MLKSFLNGFSGGIGRTFGRLLAYIIFGLLAFILIYYTSKETDYNLADLLFMRVDAAAIYSDEHGCASTFYDIAKQNGDITYGQTSTSYNIAWEIIYFSGTENLDANSYYDMKIVFRSNLSLSSFDDGDPEIYKTSSLCGSWSQKFQVSSFGISGTTLTIRFLTGTSMVDYWGVKLFYNYTGSQGINSVTLTKVDLSGSSGIISNANDNTNSIINNNDENTQDIIDNQNQNTQDILDSQQDINESLNSTCTNGPNIYNSSEFSSITGKYLDSTGSQVSNSSYNISKMFLIKPDTQYNLKFNFTASSPSYCFYRTNSMDSNSLIACYSYNNSNNITFTSPTAANYLVISIRSVNNVTITGPICNNWDTEAQNETNSKLDQMLALPTVKLILFSNSIQEWSNWINNPVASFVTLPVELVSKINTISQSSCSPFSLGSLFNTNLSFECFTLSDILPNTLVNIIDIIACISLSFVIVKRIYETVSNLITLGGENEVKSYFKVPTPLEFMASFF